jgi:hypothetical protein
MLQDLKGMKGPSSTFNNLRLTTWTHSVNPALKTEAEVKTQNEAAVKSFRENAEKFRALAEKTSDPAQRLGYLETALLNYQLLGEKGPAQYTLGMMRQAYRQLGNDTGVTRVEAELSLMDGDFEKALAGFRSVESLLKRPELKLSQEDRDNALLEANLKISATLQVMAAQAMSKGNSKLALQYLKECLQRTPSEMLQRQTLHAAITYKRDLEARIQAQSQGLQDRVRRADAPFCNSNCHNPNPSPSDMQYWSLVDMATRPEIKLGGAFLMDPQSTPFADDAAVFQNWRNGAFAPGPGGASLDTGPYQGLRRATDEDKLQFARDAKAIRDLWNERNEFLKEFPAIVRLALGEPKDLEGRIRESNAVMEAYMAAGESGLAVEVMKKQLAEVQKLREAETDPVKKRDMTLKDVNLSHQLASLYLQCYQEIHITNYLTDAHKLLDDSLQKIKDIDPEGFKLTADGSNKLLTAKEFLQIQNRFLKAELYLIDPKEEKDIDTGQKILEDLVYGPPIDLWNFEKGDPQEALMGRVRLRLAQVYYGRTGTNHHISGDIQVENILREFPGDKELTSQALFAQGMCRLKTGGKSLEGLQILRRIQVEYAGTEADRLIRSSSTLSNIRDSQGVIKENINESDYGEALKVALDRAVNSSGSRKLGFMALGALVVLLLIPEPSSKVVALGMLGGLGVEMGVGVVQGRGDIMDAFQTGISNVDSRQNIRNLFMLAVDIAVFIPAGAVGRVAGTATKAGLSYVARGASRIMPRLELTALEKTVFNNLGKGIMVGVPFVVESTAAYTTLEIERSVLFGTDFHWSAKDAMLMMALCGNFAMARRLGAGAKLSTHPQFSQGKLSPVYHNGRPVGLTNTAGKVVGWTTDTAIGATAHYGLLLGMNRAGTLGQDVPDYDQFLTEQVITLGGLHAGAKLAGKVSHHALDNALLKLDRRANQWLSEAKENIRKQPPPSGGIGPWGGRQLAGAGAYGNVPVPENTIPPEAPARPPVSGPMMMASGDRSRIEVLVTELKSELAKNPEKGTTLEVWTEKPLDADAIRDLIKQAKARGVRFEVKDISKDEATLRIEADANGEIHAVTTNAEVARWAPKEVVLEYRASGKALLAEQIKELANQGIQRIRLTGEQEIPIHEAFSALETALGRGIQVELRNPKGAVLGRIAEGDRGLKLEIPDENLLDPKSPSREQLRELVQKVLWSGVGEIQIGSTKNNSIRMQFDPMAKRWSFMSKLPFEKQRLLLGDFLAHKTARALGAKDAADPLNAQLQRFWQGAMEHVMDYESYNRSGDTLPETEYVGGSASAKWDAIAQAMIGFAAKSPKNRDQLKQVLSLLEKNSQPDADSMLGFKPFDKRAFDDNAFELSRIFEASRRNDKIKVDVVLSMISETLGSRGNVEVYGAVVGNFYKAMIPPEPGTRGPAKEPDKDHRGAANEIQQLDAMIKQLNLAGGRYRITVIPEDRLHGQDNIGRTPTPDWIVESLGVDGRPTQSLTVEVKNRLAEGWNERTARDDVSKSVGQVLNHKFAASGGTRDGMVIVRVYDSNGREAALESQVLKAIENEHQTLQMTGQGRAMEGVVFRVIYGDKPTPTNPMGKEYDSILIGFKNGKWTKLPAPKFQDTVLPPQWNLPKVSGGN